MRSFEQLADTFVTAIVPFYALAVAAVYALRRKNGYDPAFRVPGYPVVPAIFVLGTIYLLASAVADPGSRWGTLGVFGVILLGVPIYFLVARRSAQSG
jgi:amino acid transporter